MASQFESSNPWAKKLERIFDLSDEDRAVLDKLVGRTKRYDAGQVLLREGEVPSHVLIVLDGCLASISSSPMAGGRTRRCCCPAIFRT